MSDFSGPLHEISFTAADDVLTELDEWLEGLLRTARLKDEIDDVRVFGSNSDSEGYTLRTCQFQIRNDNALDELLDEYFAGIDAQVALKFDGQVRVQSRNLQAEHPYEHAKTESLVCLNCKTRLRGQYCGNCGQRSRSRLISIWQLLREAFGDLFELDSRLWRTLVPLLIRPGQLTKDYLEGRRARYMPPFRSYLVLSVVFFVVAFFDPQNGLSLLFEPEPAAQQVAEPEEDAAAAAKAREEEMELARKKLEELALTGKVPVGIAAEIIDDDDEFEIRLGGDDSESGFFGDCAKARISDDEEVPEWVKKRFSDERLRQICERNNARGNKNFADAILDNIPIALIVLLPAMALVLKLLYPLSRRYFVEHLLFFVHFHAFFFFILILQILFARMMALAPVPDAVPMLVLVATSFYIPVYLYKAMRCVYGQGHIITIIKYLMLLIAYLSGATLTMLGAFLVAVLSV